MYQIRWSSTISGILFRRCVVADHHLWLAALDYQPVQFPHHADAGERRVGHQRQALVGTIIEDGQDAEAAAVGVDPTQSRATTGRSASSEPATRSAGEILRDLNHPIETGSELRMEISDEARRWLFTLRVITEAHE